MKIILTSETSIRLLPGPGAMTIEAQSTEQQYSPFHMLASSLAFCTFSVMYSWATHVKIPADDLTFDVSWEFADDPHRVGSLSLTFNWQSLPEKRINAATRAAELCTVHATLMHPPKVNIALTNESRTMTKSTNNTTSTSADRASAQGLDEKEIARDAAAGADGVADLPPKPVQQGDGQEANTARTPAPETGAESR